MFEPIKNRKKALQIMAVLVIVILVVGLIFLLYQKLTNPHGFVSTDVIGYLGALLSLIATIIIYSLYIVLW
jgi:protein-S-isoprenylcysteine O-methyltransferase Ste14